MVDVDDDFLVLTPVAAVDEIIKPRTHKFCALYSSSIEKINDELYDCTPGILYQFIKYISLR